MNNPYKDLYEKKDKECDELIKKYPLGYYDKEFEELIILKTKYETWQKAQDSIQCESCGRKDCLNILCHADLEIIKQDVEKKAQNEILDRVESIVMFAFENKADGLIFMNRLRNQQEKIE
jgi:hypothetical protein